MSANMLEGATTKVSNALTRSMPAKLSKGLKRPGALRRTLQKLSPKKLFTGLKKEAEVSKELHADVLATLKRMKEKDPGLAKQIDEAYGFAVFPAAGRASLVLGISYGKGEVYKEKSLNGYAGLVQLTIGVQVGGVTYSELILFQDKKTFSLFKQGKVGFAANASAVMVKAGASAANKYKNGMKVFVQPEGGLLLEADIGGQKLIFRPAALSRGKSADDEPEAPSIEAGKPSGRAAKKEEQEQGEEGKEAGEKEEDEEREEGPEHEEAAEDKERAAPRRQRPSRARSAAKKAPKKQPAKAARAKPARKSQKPRRKASPAGSRKPRRAESWSPSLH